MADRRRHFAVERLSKEGQDALRAALAENLTMEGVLAALEAKTGETLSMSALQRWAKWEALQRRFAERQAALETATELIKSVADDRFIRLLNQGLKERLLDKEAELGELTAVELMAHVRGMEKLELEHRKLNIAEQAVQADRVKAVASEKQAEAALTQAAAAMKRAELMEKKLREAADKLKEAETKVRSGRGLTAEELGTIREQIFGLVADASEEEQHASS